LSVSGLELRKTKDFEGIPGATHWAMMDVRFFAIHIYQRSARNRPQLLSECRENWLNARCRLLAKPAVRHVARE
jgi:hypothetical protein